MLTPVMPASRHQLLVVEHVDAQPAVFLKHGFIALLRLMHTQQRRRSVTEHTAVAVMPQRPAGPSVVMIFTAADRLAMASRKRRRFIFLRHTTSLLNYFSRLSN